MNCFLEARGPVSDSCVSQSLASGCLGRRCKWYDLLSKWFLLGGREFYGEGRKRHAEQLGDRCFQAYDGGLAQNQQYLPCTHSLIHVLLNAVIKEVSSSSF